MFDNIAKDIVGLYFIYTGFWDAYKYRWGADAIRKAKTAKGHSRRFMNVAIRNDAVRIVYLSFFQPDIFLLLSSIIALACMAEMWWTIYIYYPYKKRNKRGFKRPDLCTYTINSIIPNNVRKRL